MFTKTISEANWLTKRTVMSLKMRHCQPQQKTRTEIESKSGLNADSAVVDDVDGVDDFIEAYIISKWFHTDFSYSVGLDAHLLQM
jgi:hypothetical protein